jgi:hypothetical protein
MSKLDERSEGTTLERTNSVGHRLGWVLAMPENALGYTPGVFVKSAQVIESKGDELPRTAKECAVRAPLEESSRAKKSEGEEQESKKVWVGQGHTTPGEFV